MQEIKKGWKKVKLEEICIQVTDGTHDSPKLLDKGVPLIKGKNISGGIIDFENSDKISYEDHLKVISRSKPEKGNILFSNIGSVGDTVLIKTDIEFSIKNVALFKANLNKICNLYLYYSVLNPTFKNDLLNKKSGSAQPFITLSVLRNQELLIPENIQTQQKIASILSKYDDLIENNNKRIKILEETAQSIYEEWFVKYNFPGSENIKMIDSGNDDFGMIPEGWGLKKVEDYVDFVRGVEPGSKNYKENKNEDDIVFIRVGDLGNRNSGIYINIDLSKGKVVNEEDVLVTFDGTVGIVKRGFYGCYSTGIRKLSGKKDFISNYFLYLLFKSENIQNKIKEHAKGTTILHAGESIKYMEFILATEDVYNRFNDIVGKILDEILNIEKQNQILKETRDLLIPRLVNGELDVENLDIK